MGTTTKPIPTGNLYKSASKILNPSNLIPFDQLSIKSIFRGIKFPSPGLLLFIMGMTGMYIVPFLYQNSFYGGMAPGTYRYYLLSWLLVSLGAALETISIGFIYLKRNPILFSLFIISVFFISLRSILDGGQIILIFQKISPFIWLLLIPAVGYRSKNWPWIFLTVFIQVPLSVYFALNAFFVEGVTSRKTTIEFVGQNFLAISFYMSFFLFMMLPLIRDWRLKAVTVLVMAVEVIRNIFFYNRLIFFILPIQILLLVVIYFKSRGYRSVVTRSVFIIITVCVIGLVIALSYSSDNLIGNFGSVFEDAYIGVNARLIEGGGVITMIRENERWIEIRAVINSMDPLDWIFGKGLDAKWSSAFFAKGDERNMVHNTFMHAIYWGGIFLLLYIMIPIKDAAILFLNTKNITGLCCSAYLLLTVMGFSTHLRTLATLDWILFCLCVGVCFWVQIHTEEESLNN